MQDYFFTPSFLYTQIYTFVRNLLCFATQQTCAFVTALRASVIQRRQFAFTLLLNLIHAVISLL